MGHVSPSLSGFPRTKVFEETTFFKVWPPGFTLWSHRVPFFLPWSCGQNFTLSLRCSFPPAGSILCRESLPSAVSILSGSPELHILISRFPRDHTDPSEMFLLAQTPLKAGRYYSDIPRRTGNHPFSSFFTKQLPNVGANQFVWSWYCFWGGGGSKKKKSWPLQISNSLVNAPIKTLKACFKSNIFWLAKKLRFWITCKLR